MDHNSANRKNSEETTSPLTNTSIISLHVRNPTLIDYLLSKLNLLVLIAFRSLTCTFISDDWTPSTVPITQGQFNFQDFLQSPAPSSTHLHPTTILFQPSQQILHEIYPSFGHTGIAVEIFGTGAKPFKPITTKVLWGNCEIETGFMGPKKLMCTAPPPPGTTKVCVAVNFYDEFGNLLVTSNWLVFTYAKKRGREGDDIGNLKKKIAELEDTLHELQQMFNSMIHQLSSDTDGQLTSLGEELSDCFTSLEQLKLDIVASLSMYEFRKFLQINDHLIVTTSCTMVPIPFMIQHLFDFNRKGSR